jgi:hypothetical protein
MAGRNDSEFQLFVSKLAGYISDQLDRGTPQSSIIDDLVRKGYPKDNVEELVMLTVSSRWLTQKETLLPTIVTKWEERANKRAKDKQVGVSRMRWGVLLILGGAIIGVSMTLSDTDVNPLIPYIFFGALISGGVYFVIGFTNRFFIR